MREPAREAVMERRKTKGEEGDGLIIIGSGST